MKLDPAVAFFQATFSQTEVENLSDAQIQRRLLKSPDPLACLCLRCYVSWIVKDECQRLATGFGKQHGFTSRELYSFVLNDFVPNHFVLGDRNRDTLYKSFGEKVLEAYDPDRGSLESWMRQMVRHDPELNQFLIEHGVYLVSDWAILNDTNPRRLQRVLQEFFHFTSYEVERTIQLVDCYHKVYRADRRRDRQQGRGGKCCQPTQEQLQRIAHMVVEVWGVSAPPSPETILKLLQNAASNLRQYRISIVGGRPPEERRSADDVDPFDKLSSEPDLDEQEREQKQDDFLHKYRHECCSCLYDAIQDGVCNRIRSLRKKDGEKANRFFHALRLYYCNCMSMTAIAPEVGLEKQFQVTRLLKLKELREDILYHWLTRLVESITELAHSYVDRESLLTARQKIKAALEELTASTMQEAESEDRQPTRSSQSFLCHNPLSVSGNLPMFRSSIMRRGKMESLMTYQDLWLDVETHASESAIDLAPEHFERATAASNPIFAESQQWQVYLNTLALEAFEQWLDTRAPELTLQRDRATVLHPPTASIIDAVCNLQVRDFKVCLLTVGCLVDEEIAVPKAALDLPEYQAHFYAIVQVDEERDSALILGFLSYDELQQQRAAAELVADADWNYTVPMMWFDPEGDRLLLYLRCLDAAAITLPSVPNRISALAAMQAELHRVLPQVQNRPLQEVLTWEQAEVVLTQPTLLDWAYQMQQAETIGSDRPAQLLEHLTDRLTILTRQAVNVGQWLVEEADRLVQELSWILLPNMQLVREIRSVRLRSPVEEFEDILNQLQRSNTVVPDSVRGAYRDLGFLNSSYLRLYALTWMLDAGNPDGDWTLLLVLGAPSRGAVPQDVQLRMSDRQDVLIRQQIAFDEDSPYSFTRVIGDRHDTFVVTVSAGGVSHTLPPFQFNRDRG
ncbi:MAG: DUF1822 family protein [Coleofasciculaceae cyanobacterium SM2_3_26]|nr:DUF1822 family protein [Coleofasciculaceae cyanobacterium SM2_3_26]